MALPRLLEYIPTEIDPLEQQVIEEYLDPNNRCRIREISARMGLTRGEFIKILNRSNVSAVLERKMQERETLLDAIAQTMMTAKMLEGDTAAIRLHYERRGMLKRVLEHTGTVTLRPMSPDEAQAELEETERRLKALAPARGEGTDA